MQPNEIEKIIRTLAWGYEYLPPNAPHTEGARILKYGEIIPGSQSDKQLYIERDGKILFPQEAQAPFHWWDAVLGRAMPTVGYIARSVEVDIPLEAITSCEGATFTACVTISVDAQDEEEAYCHILRKRKILYSEIFADVRSVVAVLAKQMMYRDIIGSGAALDENIKSALNQKFLSRANFPYNLQSVRFEFLGGDEDVDLSIGRNANAAATSASEAEAAERKKEFALQQANSLAEQEQELDRLHAKTRSEKEKAQRSLDREAQEELHEDWRSTAERKSERDKHERDETKVRDAARREAELADENGKLELERVAQQKANIQREIRAANADEDQRIADITENRETNKLAARRDFLNSLEGADDPVLKTVMFFALTSEDRTTVLEALRQQGFITTEAMAMAKEIHPAHTKAAVKSAEAETLKSAFDQMRPGAFTFDFSSLFSKSNADDT